MHKKIHLCVLGAIAAFSQPAFSGHENIQLDQVEVMASRTLNYPHNARTVTNDRALYSVEKEIQKINVLTQGEIK